MGTSLDSEFLEKWKVSDAIETYRIRPVGARDTSGINKAGHVTVHPSKPRRQVHRPEGLD